MVSQQEISIIACIAQNGAIGFHNHLLYHIKQDMQRFKALTTGHTVIMGRKTYHSLPSGPLPHRRNIIFSKTMQKEQSLQEQSEENEPAKEVTHRDWQPFRVLASRYEVCRTMEEALDRCRTKGEEEVFIIGGAMLYRAALTLATRLYLTIVEDTPRRADTFFPLTTDEVEHLSKAGWTKVREEAHYEDKLTFRFVDMALKPQ